jgi:hypothetical protein
MRKVGLEIDALRVETFETARAPAARGTVRAHDSAEPSGTGGFPSDDPCATCADSCWGACVETQALSCGGSCEWYCTRFVC